MKKNKDKIESKILRLIVIIYFFITIPIFIIISFGLFRFSKTYLEYNRKYNDLSCLSYCETEDNYCKKICYISGLDDRLGNVNPNDKYKKVDISDTEKIYKKFESKKHEDMNIKYDDYSDYYFNRDYNSIEEFAKEHGYGRWHYNYILGCFYVCLGIIVYVILTDILRGAVYYIDIGTYKLYIRSKLKSLFIKNKK